MKVRIVFYRSSSKHYESTCLQCEAFDNYTQNKSINELVIGLQELKEKQQKVMSILGTLKNWTKSEFFIDDVSSNAKGIESILSIVQCEQSYKSCVITDEYCFGETGWGCKFISSVALRHETYYPYRSNLCWYEFGHFEHDEWLIDKDRIFAAIESEAEEKHVAICKCFSMQRIENIIKSLPDKIVMVRCKIKLNRRTENP